MVTLLAKEAPRLTEVHVLELTSAPANARKVAFGVEFRVNAAGPLNFSVVVQVLK
jgi:hypothetical protein